MSAYNHYYGITEQITPEPNDFENENEIKKCDCCHEPTDSFIIHRGYIICNDCIEHQGEDLNKIVETIKQYSNASYQLQKEKL